MSTDNRQAQSDNQHPHEPETQASAETQPQVAAKRRWRPTRRGFLIGLGATAGLLALGIGAGVPYARLQIAGTLDGAEGQPSNFPEDPWAWFEVLPDSRIRLYVNKVEMGQGVHTSIGQVAADELGIAWEDLDVAMATTARDLGNAITSGSNSVSGTFIPVRQAAATLMAMLRQEASAQLGVEESDLAISGRGFATQGDAQRLDFAAIVSGKQGEWEAPEAAPPLKDRSEFRYIGQPVQRRDFEAKLTGQAVYGYDARLEGMKYGAVARPPTVNGKLKSAEAGSVETMPGVHTVVIADGFAGVVADTRPQAHAAAAQLQVEWDPGALWQQAELEQMVTVGNGSAITIQNEGDAGGQLRGETTVTAEYRTPFAVHAHLEAQAALVDVQPDRIRVWCSTQAQSSVQAAVAKALGVEENTVEVIPTYVGGGFGRKVGDEVAIEAAQLSKAAGVPVHVGWTRAEDMRYGYFRPPTHHRLSARLDAEGNLVAIEHQQASGDVAFAFLPNFLAPIMGADFGAYRGALIRYAVPNKRTIAHRTEIPVRTGWWRGLGLLANVYAVESFMDEVASAAGADPLEFRLRHLDDAVPSHVRLKAVLNAAAELGGWGTPAPEGRARGIACCLDVDTAVAMVAEVSVSEEGKIRVHHVAAAMDPGLVVNPDGARAQVEGNIMWGVGSALIEELTFKDGQVEAGNFDRYPLLTMREAPDVDVVLLEAGDGRPRGVGEPPIGPVAAAVANAVFALNGKRLRQLPMNEARVQAAVGTV
jgi:isoquinoline 1-oxidoreductase beta subunit